MTHELKTLPIYFAALADGTKTFEVRRNDRGFKVGDILRLREYSMSSGAYSGRELTRVITYIMTSEQFPAIAPEWCVLGIKPCQQVEISTPAASQLKNFIMSASNGTDIRFLRGERRKARFP